MYGLPADFDPSFFEGETLLQVCVGLHELILRFDHELDLMIECDVHTNIGGSQNVYADPRQAGANLLVLLQEDVLSARSSEDGTLVLGFSSGEIELRDTSESYESYQTHRGPEVYVV